MGHDGGPGATHASVLLRAVGARRRTFAFADKIGHGLMYFATFLCFLLAAVWRPGRGDGLFPTMALPFAIGVVIAGTAIEVLQRSQPADDTPRSATCWPRSSEPSARSRSTRGCAAAGVKSTGKGDRSALTDDGLEKTAVSLSRGIRTVVETFEGLAPTPAHLV